MNKKIKEYTPNEILITTDSLKSIINEFERLHGYKTTKEKSKDTVIATGTSTLLAIISIAPLFVNNGVKNKVFTTIWTIVSIAIILVLIAFIGYHLFKWNESKAALKSVDENEIDLSKMIQKIVQKTTRYTAIMRINYQSKGGRKYLVGDDFFLPHGNLNSDKAIEDQSEYIIQSLYDDYYISARDVVKITPISESPHFSIKPIHNRIQMNAYVFYDVTLKIQSKDRIVNTVDGRKWVTLKSMRNNAEACASNKDVIDILGTLPKPDESFENVLGNLKIIWNITSKCHYNCAICATYDSNREELNATDKLKVLHNLFTAKDFIRTLDFAGGEPLHFGESKQIIQTAIDHLGAEKLSVTTTGDGIASIANAEGSDPAFSELLRRCEITIDAAHSNLQKGDIANNAFNRKEKSYCSENYKKIDLLPDHTEFLTINVPIINDDLSSEEINTLVSQIKRIKENNPHIHVSATLIRLMPVGRFTETYNTETYQKYNPIRVVKEIRQSLLAAGVECNLHCSLRILSKLCEEEPVPYCTMLENKLGIDCAGNVFACAWAGYLNQCTSPTNNPFYLGNLTKTSLLDILNGKRKTTGYTSILRAIESKNKRHYCSVVSYYANKECFFDFDYLSSDTTS